MMPDPRPDQAPRRLRVLVADDNAAQAEMLALLLRLWGHEVAVAFDGLEALRAARACPPQAALLDIGMPKLDGWRVAAELRRLLPGRPLLVAITARCGEGDRRRSREAGFDHHLVKPADPCEVQALLEGFAASCLASPEAPR
jgi:CheY-like chemotaxis protein